MNDETIEQDRLIDMGIGSAQPMFDPRGRDYGHGPVPLGDPGDGERVSADGVSDVQEDGMTYTIKQRILINLTQMFCQVWFGLIKKEKTYPDESTSAFVYRTQKLRWIRWVNWIMGDPEHCRQAYIHEFDGTQNAPEYRQKFDEESA